jgi:predicted 3-demethylubiquinone-9 3-methyltransferase (glyoxalase superfamily)
MNDQTIAPCLWLDDQAEAAAQLYTRIIPGSRVTGTSRYPERGENPSGKPPGSVLTVDFELAGQRFTALNGGPMFTINPTVSFFIQGDDAAEARRIFAALAEGGRVLMALDSYPWSPLFGWVADRYGVSWQIILGRPPGSTATIVPCLMFAGPQQGKAEAAMQAYTRVFPDSRVDRVQRYAAGEGPEAMVKHGRFTLAGQPMVAMDNHRAAADMTFNEGVSLQVMCKDQAEIDRYWTSLSEGGQPGVCGWLKDRFGLSWQIVPRAIAAWMTSADTAARDRAFQAVMKMKKLDIAGIQAAFDGR